MKRELGELIGINNSWFRYRGHTSDIDNASLNGVYTFGAEAQNSPLNGSGKCLTFGNGIDDYGQIVMTWDSRLIYYRGKIGAAWKQIQTTYISRKTKCSAFTKHFVPESHLLTQIKM